MKKQIFFIAVTLLIFSFSSAMSYAQKNENKPLTAQEIVNNAVKEAQHSHKKVFLMFHASWCHWCHLMDSLMTKSSVNQFFKDNFIITHISIRERKGKENLNTPGGMQMFDSMGGGNGGIPFWVIIDKNGKLLANSNAKNNQEPLSDLKGDNTGCPVDVAGRTYFIRVLKETTEATPEALKAIEMVFTI